MRFFRVESFIILYEFCILIELSSCCLQDRHRHHHNSKNQIHDEWEEFKSRYHKTYDNDEEQTRMSIFEANLQKIFEHNVLYEKGLVSFTMGMNQFGDMTDDEFLSTFAAYDEDLISDRHKLCEDRDHNISNSDRKKSFEDRDQNISNSDKYKSYEDRDQNISNSDRNKSLEDRDHNISNSDKNKSFEDRDHHISNSDGNISFEDRDHHISNSDGNISFEDRDHNISNSDRNKSFEDRDHNISNSDGNISFEDRDHNISNSDGNISFEDRDHHISNSDGNISFEDRDHHISNNDGNESFEDHDHNISNTYRNESFVDHIIYKRSVRLHKRQNYIPSYIDWRKKGAVTRVKYQGWCASCYAFSAAGVIEAQYYLKTKKLKSFSVQQLVDCSWNHGNKGCNGGLPQFAFEYLMIKKSHTGIQTEQYYKYLGKNSTCRCDKKYHKTYYNPRIKYYKKLTKCEKTLKRAVAAYGPVSVVVELNGDFQFYETGVFYSGKPCVTPICLHAMLVVGYGSSRSEGDYWLLKNSWSKHWGEYGYMKLARNRCNHRGIADRATIAYLK